MRPKTESRISGITNCEITKCKDPLYSIIDNGTNVKDYSSECFKLNLNQDPNWTKLGDMSEPRFVSLLWANFSAIVYIAVWIHVMFDYMKQNIQGVKGESGKCLSSKSGRNQCLY